MELTDSDISSAQPQYITESELRRRLFFEVCCYDFI